MAAAKRLVIFILLFLISLKLNAKCHAEEGKRVNDVLIAGRIQSKTNKRPNDSNMFTDGVYKTRHKRGSPDFNYLRMKLNEEKKLKNKELMAADANPRMEPNSTRVRLHEPQYFGGINTEQRINRKFDNIKKVYEYRNMERDFNYAKIGTECDFEDTCKWTWKTDIPDGFFVTTGSNVSSEAETGPKTDPDNNNKGHFLMVRIKPSSSNKETNWNWTITSPLFDPSGDNCKIQFWIHQENMNQSVIRIVLHNINKTQVIIDQIEGDNARKWIKYEKAIGKITQKFKIMIEVDPARISPADSSIAFDNIKMLKCYPDNDRNDSCTASQYRCMTTNLCINNSEVCDITQDCKYGDDETQNCDKIPFGGRCNFEQDECGWYNAEGKKLTWTIRHNGSTATNLTGPAVDHTYGNSTGKYLHVTVAMGNEAGFASTATLKSVVFNPPPRVHGNSSSRFYNSCNIRFYLHQSGNHKSGFMLQVTELRPKENVSTDLYWSYNNFVDPWIRQVVILPNITYKYYLHFDFRKGIRYIRDIAIDDFSLSPQCFGLNIPGSELNGYNYWNPYIEHPSATEPHKTFANATYYEIGTCNVTGIHGPSQENCTTSYSGTPVKIEVLRDVGLAGIQKWTVPSDGYYTFILFGASGGKGGGAMGSSRGAMARVVLEFRKGQVIYMLVGQEGTSACVKTLAHQGNSSCTSSSKINVTGVRGVLNMEIDDGGGGGGGGTFIFTKNKTGSYIPLAVAGGGGGLGLRFIDTGVQHGQAINMSRPAVSGHLFLDDTKCPGAGGGWEKLGGIIPDESRLGKALLTGGTGGTACYSSTDGRGNGGFGGGGGGCRDGGGGGGYSGGNSCSINLTNGEGGYSFITTSRALPNFSEALSGYHAGPGTVLIIPAIPGCGCDYRCLALDARRSQVACICPKNWKLDSNQKTCIVIDTSEKYPTWFVILLIICVICLTIAIGVICIMMYNRYQQKAEEVLRRKMLSGPDLQLNRLRVASDSMMTEYNPNYEFGGVVYTLKDLKDIPRDQLRLVNDPSRALGQGAFGEVYQGFYRQRRGDTVEMPVAVKTLPEMSTSQAEMDFLMEALIMSKFNHPNIVHFIGVCFDKHPRFIVLELLVGGDLKNFLRESRPKPERSSSLSMKDLVLISIDIAKGCKYLEENRFIHRDIAARNCLLTTKGPGRVVKIADFGMSRDIYRSDYYRKGGKAMLPIKWMPPEAFLDGIFTSKTDVWSFGVLLWEILSMGYMPYTGCANREVMQLVTSGGRLEPPANCPGPIYGIMTQCWHPTPEQRPTFSLILERLGYCAQDPQVMNAPLPVFNRAPSHERDATVMRPNTTDDNCLQVEVPQTTDYLIPNHTMSVNPSNVIGSSSSIDKLLPENFDNSWETSFVLPQSKSTQPLLQESDSVAEEAVGSVEKLLAPESHVRQTSAVPSMLNSVHTNHNNNAKNDSNLKSGISLDAGALVKQTMSNSNPKYGKNDVTGNGVIQNGPYTNQNNYTSEISC